LQGSPAEVLAHTKEWEAPTIVAIRTPTMIESPRIAG